MQRADVGVIVGRFQIHKVHDAHRQLLDSVYQNHAQTIIVLGLSPTKVTIRNPLDFESRKRMLSESYPNATIIPLRDHVDDREWSKNLDAAVSDLVSPAQTVCLYGGRDSFLRVYTGRYPTQELDQKLYISASEIRKTITKSVKASEDFRAGVIWSSANQYPKVHPTVDVAVLDEPEGNVWMVRKATESLWRFPGGFVDPKDATFEAAARREISEELNGIAITDPIYMGSIQIDDWRYRQEVDKIITVFYRARKMFGSPQPTDDVSFAQAFPITSELSRYVVPEHQPLVKCLLDWKKSR